MLAQQGALATTAEIRAQVLRLASDPARRPAVRSFFRQYFDYSAASDVFKEPKTCPWHKPETLIGDTDALVQDLLAEKGDVLKALLTTGRGFARQESAASYGLTGQTAKDPVRVDSPPAHLRAGVLTQPSFLAAVSHADENDPILRGKFIRGSLLCGVIPPIPPNVAQDVPTIPNATLRERLKAHVKEANCAACHSLMDPLGFALEVFDHTGRPRLVENGKMVDATGVLTGAGASDGAFNGPVELMAKLAVSPVVEDCLVRHAFRYFLGRDENERDACSVTAAKDGFGKSGRDTLELVAGVMSSDSFLYRN
jgi:hypothetical protein